MATPVSGLPVQPIMPPGVSIDQCTWVPINFAAGATTAIIAAATGKVTYLAGLFGTPDTAGSIQFLDASGGTALTGIMPLGAAGNGIVLAPASGPWLKTASGKGLFLKTVTCTFDGVALVYQVDG